MSTAISLPWLLGFSSCHSYIGNDLGGALCCISELAALGIAGFIYMEYVWRPKQWYSAEYLSVQKFFREEDLSGLGEALAEDLMAIAGICGKSYRLYGVIRIVEIVSTYRKVRSIEYRGRIVTLMGKSRTGIYMGFSYVYLVNNRIKLQRSYFERKPIVSRGQYRFNIASFKYFRRQISGFS